MDWRSLGLRSDSNEITRAGFGLVNKLSNSGGRSSILAASGSKS
jgi:hypothetical protein